MNILPPTQQYATNITQSHLNSSSDLNLDYTEKDTTNKNLQDVPTSNKNIKATHPTEYINNYLLDPYNTEQNLLNLSFQNINPVTLSINSNTNINNHSNPVTTATVTTNIFCTKKATSILHTKTHTVARPYKCTECSKAFSKKSNLKIHIRIHTEDKPYKCSYQDCDKGFKIKTNLQRHIRIHTGERPYKCSYQDCDKAFSRNTVLQNHIRTHTGERPYKCSYQDCDKAFSQNTVLQNHIRTHTGEKPYKCTECSKAFNRQFILINHIRTHTEEKPYKCTKCKKKFNQKNSLKRHISILHHSKEVLTCKKQPIKSSYHQSGNTFKQNECFKDNNLQKDLSLIIAPELLNVSKAVSKIAPEIVATPKVITILYND